jgi:MFS family permease
VSAAEQPAALGLRGLLTVRNFRLFWFGETVSVLGDQFYFVALPWLVLQLTGSGLALGSVLMTAAIPRAVLMLAGGAATDRFSSRSVMLASNFMRCLVVSILAVLVLNHTARMWHVYVLAAGFGTFDAFFYPAYTAMVPGLLQPAQLAAGNAFMQGSVQLTGLVGPAAAGVVIGGVGLGAAFGVDAVSFVVSLAMLLLITTTTVAAAASQHSLLTSMREGISYALTHVTIRSLLVAFAVMNLFLTGPFMVGAPLLAKQRFAGAAALGLLYSTFGAGALAGTVIAGRDRREHRLGPILVTVYGVAGLTMITLGLLWRVWASASVLALLGVIVGYSNVQMLAYLQRQTEATKMGRVMSIIMFCAHGLLPVSYVVSGAVSKLGTTVLFLASGVTVIVITSVLFREPEFWRKENAAAVLPTA